MSDDESRRKEIVRRTFLGLEEDLDDLRDELGRQFEDYETRLERLTGALPPWLEMHPASLRTLFSFEFAEGAARLGPRAVAMSAAHVEKSILELREVEDKETLDEAREEVIALLGDLESTARECALDADSQLGELLDSILIELEDQREADESTLRELVTSGDLEKGRQARKEIAELWEEQRNRARELKAAWEPIEALVFEGVDLTVSGIEELRSLLHRTVEGLGGTPTDRIGIALADDVARVTLQLQPEVATEEWERDEESDDGGPAQVELPMWGATDPGDVGPTDKIDLSSLVATDSTEVSKPAELEEILSAESSELSESSDTAESPDQEQDLADNESEPEDESEPDVSESEPDDSPDIAEPEDLADNESEPEEESSATSELNDDLADNESEPLLDHETLDTVESERVPPLAAAPASESSELAMAADFQTEETHGHAMRVVEEWRPVALVERALVLLPLVLFVAVVSVSAIPRLSGVEPAFDIYVDFPWVFPWAFMSVATLTFILLVVRHWRMRWNGGPELVQWNENEQEVEVVVDRQGVRVGEVRYPRKQLSAHVYRWESKPDGTFGWAIRLEPRTSAAVTMVAPERNYTRWDQSDLRIEEVDPSSWQTTQTVVDGLRARLGIS